MSKKKIDYEEELDRIARKSNFNIRRTEYAFENRIKKIDAEIDQILDEKIKEFENSKQLTQDYLSIDNDTLVIDRYREKLKKI